MTQQAVSRQIISLENELDEQLFTRNARSIKLTKVGVLYRDLFQKWVEQLERTKHIAKRIREREMNLIRIAYLHRLELPEKFCQVISKFKQLYPQITIEYQQITGSETASLLEDGVFDLCIAHHYFFDNNTKIERHYIQHEYKQIAISSKHPLYSESFELDKLNNCVWLYSLMEGQNQQSAISDIKREVADLKLTPRYFKEVKNHEILSMAVEMGEGVTICSNVTKLYNSAGIHCFPTGISAMLDAAWLKSNQNPNVRTLISDILTIDPD